jgi:hypothetical protein
VSSTDYGSAQSAWLEWRSRLSAALDVEIGLQGGRERGSGVVRPKVVAHYRTSGATVAFLAYPTFNQQRADLLPVETWAQPFEVGGLDLVAGGSFTNYELSAEHPLGDGLLEGTVFYREGRGVLLPLVDPQLAPIVDRALSVHGRLWGANVAVERPLLPGLSLRAFARYTGTHDDGGGDLPYIPRVSAGVQTNYVHRSGVRAQLALTYQGPRPGGQSAFGRQEDLAGYVQTDVRISWQQNLHLNYFLQVSDLFDRGDAFFHAYPGAGRSIWGGVDVRF